jgi:hypothetical protein
VDVKRADSTASTASSGSKKQGRAWKKESFAEFEIGSWFLKVSGHKAGTKLDIYTIA